MYQPGRSEATRGCGLRTTRAFAGFQSLKRNGESARHLLGSSLGHADEQHVDDNELRHPARHSAVAKACFSRDGGEHRIRVNRERRCREVRHRNGECPGTPCCGDGRDRLLGFPRVRKRDADRAGPEHGCAREREVRVAPRTRGVTNAPKFLGEILRREATGCRTVHARHEYTKRLLAAVPGISGAKTLLNRAGGSTPEQVPSPAEEPLTLLEVAGAVKTYRLRGRATTFRAVNDVHLVVPKGRTVAIVGESGSGKSTTAKLALRLERLDSGAVTFRGENVAKLAGERLLAFRRLVQPVFQNPYASLDPRYTVGRAIAEPLRVHRIGDSAHRKAAVAELLERVALPAAFAERYPHELSGGQRQRVAIARALALKPELVVMDEAVSALDVLVQRQILELMVSLQRDLGLSYLFISHDLAVVRQVSHYVYVMQAGRVVEAGTPEVIFGAPREEYTQRLIAAIPGRSVARDEPPHSPRFAAPRPD